MKLRLQLIDKPQGFTDLDSPQVRTIGMEVGFNLDREDKPSYTIENGGLILEVTNIAQSTRESVIAALKTMFSNEITVEELAD